MRGYWQRGVRYIHWRAREKRGGVTIFAHAEVDEVKAWPIEWRRGVFFQEEGIFLGSLNRRKFTFDAMNVRSLNLNMSQQYIPRLTVTAARVIWRNAAFITPEDMYFVPINFIAKICCEQLKETSRSTASVERDQELIAFSHRLGDLDWAPIQETGRRFVEGLPEIYIVSNVKVNGEPIGSLGDGEAVWHTDKSYLDVPPKASMLYALEVPPSGGNTSFCSMYDVYESLPPPLKERIAGLKIKHDGTYNSGGYVRQGVTPTDDPLTSPGAIHPLVCRHLDTGRRMLYLGRRRNAYLVGLGLAESEALLNELWAFVDRSEFAWEHVWRVGDLVLWDNRCTMHRRDAFDPNSRRIMHRTQVKGEQRPA